MTDPDPDWSFRQVPTFETVALLDEINTYYFKAVGNRFFL